MSNPRLVTPSTELDYRQAHARAQAATAHAIELWQQTERLSSPGFRQLLKYSADARLLARLETMPVIEQAKGIIMAQSHCGEAEAFDILRRASQRSNVPVRDLAAQIVASVTETARPATARPERQDRTSRPADTRLARAG